MQKPSRTPLGFAFRLGDFGSEAPGAFGWDKISGAVLIALATLGCLISAMGISQGLGLELGLLWLSYFIAGICGGVWLRKGDVRGFVLILIAGVGGELMSLFTYSGVSHLTLLTALCLFLPGLIFPGYAAVRLAGGFGPRIAPGLTLPSSLASPKAQIALTILACLMIMGFATVSQSAAHHREFAVQQHELAEKAQLISDQQSMIDAKDQKIAEQQRDIAEKTQQIEAQQRDIEIKAQQISDISNHPLNTPWYERFLSWVAATFGDIIKDMIEKYVGDWITSAISQ